MKKGLKLLSVLMIVLGLLTLAVGIMTTGVFVLSGETTAEVKSLIALTRSEKSCQKPRRRDLRLRRPRRRRLLPRARFQRAEHLRLHHSAALLRMRAGGASRLS